MPTAPHLAPAGDWRFLATTNRHLEAVACREISDLTGEEVSVARPGVVRFSGAASLIPTLHARARSIHRVFIELRRATCSSLADITGLVDELALPFYLGPEQSFAVRAQRRGEHSFESPDVEREVGGAIVDGYREQAGRRPPVDLEDPDLLFRVFVRDDQVRIVLDATGQRSLHRRWYRVAEHDAALRPTMAYALLHYAGYEPTDRLVDPLCGCGTIPIEAALAATGRPATANHEPAFTRFRFLDATGTDPPDPSPTQPAIAGHDLDVGAVRAADRNASEAGVRELLTLTQRDATTAPPVADLIVTDMPFGIRTDGEIHSLYSEFFETVAGGDWRRLVVHTARDDLVPLAVTESIPVRRGRLETAILVIE